MVKVPLRMRPVYLRSLVDKYNYLFANICSLPSDDRPKVETHPKRISYIVRLQSSKRKTIGCCTVDVLTYEIVVTNDDISERSILYKYQSPDWCSKEFYYHTTDFILHSKVGSGCAKRDEVGFNGTIGGYQFDWSMRLSVVIRVNPGSSIETNDSRLTS